ncbi:MAG: IclR family transcriptional regulator [Mobilitalea sp.]
MENLKINKTVARSIEILNYVATSKSSVTLASISKELSIPKSSAFDIMHTLVDKKMLKFNDETKHFSLDVKSFEIGSAYLSRNDVHSVARPFLKQLSLQTGETAFLVVENNGMIVYLDKVEGASPTRTTCVIGDRNIMHCTGLGKAILATMPIERIRLITGGGQLQVRTKNTIATFNSLMIELDKIRLQGYSIDNREDNDHVFCVAAPILNGEEHCIAAISISSVFTTSTLDNVEFYSQLITSAALEISSKFGYIKPYIYPKTTYSLF